MKELPVFCVSFRWWFCQTQYKQKGLFKGTSLLKMCSVKLNISKHTYVKELAFIKCVLSNSIQTKTYLKEPAFWKCVLSNSRQTDLFKGTNLLEMCFVSFGLLYCQIQYKQTGLFKGSTLLKMCFAQQVEEIKRKTESVLNHPF